MANGSRYSIQELADLGDVSRRTVRYYVQEGLIPAPTGVGRGRHYEQAHLDRLLEIKAHQASGHTLDEIRAKGVSAPVGSEPRGATAPPTQSMWRRVIVAPGVELHIGTGVRLPSPSRLRELTDWCRKQFVHHADDEDDHVN